MRRPVVLVAAGATFAVALALCVAGVGDDPTKLSNWQALVLGLVQGMTELLPISSSGHLILVPWLFDWTYLEENDAFNQTFDVSLHLGTCVAVGAYFWHDVVTLIRAWFGTLAPALDQDHGRAARLGRARCHDPGRARRLPARGRDRRAHGGAMADRDLPGRRSACCSAGPTGARSATRWVDLSLRQGLLVGLAQSLALMPGVSRSGITITAGRLLGLDRDSAARFSFLLLLPITVGAVVFKGITDVILADMPSGMAGPFTVGVLASLASGLIAILFLLDYVRRHSYDAFVVYRLVVAAAILLLIATGVRSATF